MTIEASDLAALRDAVNNLENPGLAVQITNIIGKPFDIAMRRLPAGVSRRIGEATHTALRTALHVAMSTMSSESAARPSNTMHKILATLSGAVGGAFGLPALAIELPVSTSIMLRSMADIARGEGENIRAVETQLACLEVFALGSRSEADDGAETGYYAGRAALARAVSEAAKFIAEQGFVEESAPAIVRLISRIAARFSVPVSEKFAAQSVPALGAAGGAAINFIFINHFQDMARGHFAIRRLERKYGADVIESAYERIKLDEEV
ncbi:MAG: EcsC family protein [Pirellulaceae bacterium]